MTFGEKLKAARVESGLKQAELAKKLNTTGNTISNWENNVSKPDLDTLSYICGILHVKASYFLHATLPEDEVSIPELNMVKRYRALDPPGQSHVDAVLQWETARVSSLAKKDSRIAELESTPATVIELSTRNGSRHLSEYFRDASAGGGIFILGNETASKIAIPDSEWDERTDYVIRVNGDSMMPDFQDGDNVMVSQRVELHHGDVGIFVVNGKAYIKEYGAEELISRNPDSPNIPIHEYDNIVCMGKVIGKLDGEFEIIND